MSNNGWRTVKLSDVATIIDSLHKTPKYSEDGKYPMVRVQDVNGSFLNLEGCKKVSRAAYLEFSRRYKPKKGDIVFCRVGTYLGRMSYVNDNDNFCLGQNTITITPSIDNLFLNYYLRSTYVKKQIESMASGASQPTISLRNIGNIDISVPEYDVQLKISHILYSYDNLIQNNKNRIHSLEESARRLYSEWFVKFQFPGHENVPMVDSELGVIPEGWEVKCLEEICHLTMGQSPKSEFYNNTGEGLPFHQGVKDFGHRFPTNRIYCSVQNRIAEREDILFSVRAPVGRINIANEKIVIGRGLSAIRSKSDNQVFLFEQLKNKFKKEDIIGGGTIFKAITKSDLQSVKLISPIETIVKMFEKMTNPGFYELETLTSKNQQLRAARDLLLPKLISGQIDVSELDIATEEMVTA